jgi:cell division protease FtsH
MNSNVKTAIFWVILILGMAMLWAAFRSQQKRADVQLIWTQFEKDVKDKKVQAVTVTGMEVHGKYREDRGTCTS